MSLTPDQREQVANELKKFAGDLNLTDDQKNKLRGLMEQARETVQAYRTANPNASRADILKAVASHRDEIRHRVVNVLTPEQLSKWDSEIDTHGIGLGPQGSGRGKPRMRKGGD